VCAVPFGAAFAKRLWPFVSVFACKQVSKKTCAQRLKARVDTKR